MNTNSLPQSVQQQISAYNQTHHSWTAMKIWQMGTCAAALLGTFFVDKDHRDEVLGLSAAAGLVAYGIHRREENKKRSIQNDIKYFDYFQKMDGYDKGNYLYAQKSKEKKEKEGYKMMGAGLACFVMGQPVLGGILTVGGLLHNTTSRDFIKVQERIVDKYTPRPWEIQNER